MTRMDNMPVKRKKRKKNNGFKYLLLFIFVFVVTLFSLSYLVKLYSPDIDVTIGEDESLTLNEEDMDIEIKPVDERLKWIQLEDEMQNSVRTPVSELDTDRKKDSELKNSQENKETSKTKEAPIPSAEDLKKAKIDFKVRYDENKSALVANNSSNQQAINSDTVTKIYIGSYSTIEEAMLIQQKVSKDISDITPFIKSVNGKYIIQLGSFSDKDKANALKAKVSAKGYNAKAAEEKK